MVWYEIVTLGDYGWFGQLIPLSLIIGMSFWLSRKDTDILFIIFPLALIVKIILPEFSNVWVLFALGLFALNIIGSKGDAFREMKSTASAISSKIYEGATSGRRIREHNEKFFSGDGGVKYVSLKGKMPKDWGVLKK